MPQDLGELILAALKTMENERVRAVPACLGEVLNRPELQGARVGRVVEEIGRLIQSGALADSRPGQGCDSKARLADPRIHGSICLSISRIRK